MQISHQIHSKNYDLRPESKKPVKYVIFHYTELNFDDSISRLCSLDAKVSCHYLIDKSGRVYQLVGDFYRAWHAGNSFWRGEENLNNHSIGIELENLGNEEFTNEQMNSLLELCNILRKKYSLFDENFLGHSDIAPSRKIDPGIFFPWEKLQKYNIGIPFSSKPVDDYENLTNDIEWRLIQKKLKFIGFDIEESGTFDKKTNDAIRAFKIHFNRFFVKTHESEILMNLDKNLIWDSISNMLLKEISPIF